MKEEKEATTTTTTNIIQQKKDDNNRIEKDVTLTLNSSNMLSLYTSFDNTRDKERVEHTRSVIINHTTNSKILYIIDNIHFDLFISIPDHIKPYDLRKFMINYYINMNHKMHNNQKTRNTYNNRIPVFRGISIQEEDNKHISDHIRLMFDIIDMRDHRQ